MANAKGANAKGATHQWVGATGVLFPNMGSLNELHRFRVLSSDATLRGFVRRSPAEDAWHCRQHCRQHCRHLAEYFDPARLSRMGRYQA